MDYTSEATHLRLPGKPQKQITNYVMVLIDHIKYSQIGGDQNTNYKNIIFYMD